MPAPMKLANDYQLKMAVSMRHVRTGKAKTTQAWPDRGGEASSAALANASLRHSTPYCLAVDNQTKRFAPAG
ncbi:MAG: hypothetical protein KF842_05230 [Caulobacter sp.]|nr:hypothetical protein [Caulobacter sp.]